MEQATRASRRRKGRTEEAERIIACSFGEPEGEWETQEEDESDNGHAKHAALLLDAGAPLAGKGSGAWHEFDEVLLHNGREHGRLRGAVEIVPSVFGGTSK